jgi:hypothetical protein
LYFAAPFINVKGLLSLDEIYCCSYPFRWERHLPYPVHKNHRFSNGNLLQILKRRYYLSPGLSFFVPKKAKQSVIGGVVHFKIDILIDSEGIK